MLAVLRLGAHQLLSTRVPPHAAVATSVDLAREAGGRKATGFVNAVLRRVGEHDLEAWVRRLAPDPKRDRHGHAVLAHAHPRWVVDALAEALAATGRAAELDDLLAADNESPTVTLVARPGLVTPTSWWTTPRRRAPPGRRTHRTACVWPGRSRCARPRPGPCRRPGRGLPAGRPGAGRRPPRGPDARWLDLCAGPGGKAALLGALAAQRARRLQAVEPQPHRADLVRRRDRGPPEGTVRTVVGDGREPDWPPGSFDRVLVDAPCTGLGALRRRPEARWRRTPEDLGRWCRSSGPCWARRIDSVRSGGVVAYVTCSPVLVETAGAVRAVLAERDDLELLDAGASSPRCRTPPARCPAPCSCGRTGTAPTRCSWRSCAEMTNGTRSPGCRSSVVLGRAGPCRSCRVVAGRAVRACQGRGRVGCCGEPPVGGPGSCWCRGLRRRGAGLGPWGVSTCVSACGPWPADGSRPSGGRRRGRAGPPRG